MPRTKKNSKSPPQAKPEVKPKQTKRLKVKPDKNLVIPSQIVRDVASVLGERHPLDVDVNTRNPLLDALLKSGETILPKKTDKKATLVCTNDYITKESNNELFSSETPRYIELDVMSCNKLKELYYKIGDPEQIKMFPNPKPKSVLIKTIICVENNIPIQEQLDILEPESTILEPELEQEPEPESTILEPEPEATILEPDTTILEPMIPEPHPDNTNIIPPLTELLVENEKVQKLDDAPIPSLDVELTAEDQKYQDELDKIPDNQDSTEYNKFLFNQEKMQFDKNAETDNQFDFLYPEHDDPNFSLKIAKHKEFNDTKFDGEIRDIKKQSNALCNAEFELLPHQSFVKNFLSFQTPYNALLLYHSLGTGKTCSSIGIAEEMRSYMRQVGINQRILIVCSPNVQQNFRLQLFDERKLVNNDGIWSLDTCVGNSLLKEINPTNLKGLNQETVVKQINTLINQSYVFIGYFELANYIKRKILSNDDSIYSEKDRKAIKAKRIRSIFDNRLIIIDEVHNIRMSSDNKKNQKTAALLMEVIKYANNVRLLMLSATPMYNNYKEIILLTNMLNMVDKRSQIREDEVFDKNGEFLPERTTPDGRKLESGRDLLKRKLTGYVSFVRGENPYTFPFRVYPDVFAPDHLMNPEEYPSLQMNKRPIDAPLQHLPVYATEIGEYQQKGYDYIINHLRNKTFNVTDMQGTERVMPTFENMESFGFMNLKQPLEALNMVFPNSALDDATANQTEGNEDIIKGSVGKEGLSNVMTYKTIKSPYMLKCEYEYKPEVLEKYGRVFIQGEISKYSNKISSICNSIKISTGIIIVYSQYIDGGVVPLALALEEMGFARFGSASHTKSLFKVPPTEPVDAISMLPRSQSTGETFNPAKYMILSGDPSFSPNNLADIKYVTNPNNKNGEKIKVILITKAASEGLDFKNIRQVHLLDPWYNLNRTEQTIGRGVRNLSHCQLPFEERNVEIYLHCTKPRLGASLTESSQLGGAPVPAAESNTPSIDSSVSSDSNYTESSVEESSVDESSAEESNAEESNISNEESALPVAPVPLPVEQPVPLPLPVAPLPLPVAPLPLPLPVEQPVPLPLPVEQPVPPPQVFQAPILQIPLIQVQPAAPLPLPVEQPAAPLPVEVIQEPVVNSISPVDTNETDSSYTESSQEQELSTETASTSNNSNEEPADLYVYRYAEQKATQIGKVTRLLKEIAVDCVLNISQTNFTVDKLMSLAQNQNVKINLSSKKDVEFKIGDKPFTDVCDYMDNCNFTCSGSSNTVTDEEIIKTTYNEDFIRMNYAMIVKRIRQLFREHFFFTREDLINSININKPYPTEQIDYVLTRFIDNKTDYILDKYGRRGFLTNRDNYYAFQPIEITDENSSLFDRSVPVEYKPYSLELELPKRVNKEALEKEFGEGLVNPETAEVDIIDFESNLIEKYNEIIEKMRLNMENAILGKGPQVIIESNENDWYKHMCNVYNKLNEYHGISHEALAKYIIYHNLDTLTFQEKLILVRNLYKINSAEKMDEDDVDPMNVEKLIKDYFNEKLLNYRNRKGIILVKDVEKSIWKIFLQDVDNKLIWKEIEDFEYANFGASIQKFIVNKSKINDLVGFMSSFKTGDIVFKSKDLTGKWNNKGVFCNIVIKKDTMKRINDILDEPVYTDSFIRQKIQGTPQRKSGVIVEKERENGIYRNGLCVILEIILRHFNDIQHKGKIWFFDSEKTALNGIIGYKKN